MTVTYISRKHPDSKVHGANMEPIWGRQDPGGPHVGPVKFAIWVHLCPNDNSWYVYRYSGFQRPSYKWSKVGHHIPSKTHKLFNPNLMWRVYKAFKISQTRLSETLRSIWTSMAVRCHARIKSPTAIPVRGLTLCVILIYPSHITYGAFRQSITASDL